MDLTQLPAEYTTAEGPEALTRELDLLLEESKKNTEFADKDHFILYQFGAQKSWIKINTKTMPFHFEYQDMLGRPATNAVKEIIARFLWEKCGEKERYMHDHGGRE